MAKRRNQTRQIVGYKVEINRTGEAGTWERVGFLFGSRGEASTYRVRNYTHVAKARVCAVRADTTPVSPREEGDGQSMTRQQMNAKFVAANQKRKAA